ncbi:MAG TPA: FAD/NAD(P)-binding oxidoreductase [Desulfurococcales archaeon]|nr:FAD/NAD(P)-binding oxidoreductase [Desulfurococcales archaeon]
MRRYRVIIIGAGIVGSSIARVLSMYENLEVHVVEKEVDVGWGSSKANTSIIHPGHEEDPEKHPLRAKLCVQGNRLWRQWVKELDIPFKFPGELMVAFSDEELKRAKKYIELARKNKVPGVKLLTDRRELELLEPNISQNAVGAVWAPTAGQINPIQAVIALIENSVDNGVKLHVETKVEKVVVKNGVVKGVETNRGFMEADIVINAAGLYADEISKTAGVDGFSIRPRKGEYYIFDPLAEPKVTRIIHPVPTPITKGVYVITTTEGNLMIGPTAVDLPEEAKEDKSVTFEGLDFVWKEAQRLVKKLPPKTMVIRVFAGLRPEPPDGRYIIKAYDNPWGFINVAGIRSPGLTSAPAIAYYVRDLIEKELDIKLEKKKSWNPYRKAITRLRDLSWEEQKALATKNPLYGWIICECMKVSAAEIIEAVKRMKKIGIKTISLDGIKFRSLAMMGRDQGGLCRVRIAVLLQKEFGIPLWDLMVKGLNTNYAIGDIKMLRRGQTAER